MLALFIASEHGESDISGYVEGDDGIFATPFELRGDEFEGLGFAVKIEEVTDPRHASFCGMIFGEDDQIIRDPRRFLQTFHWTHSFIHAGEKIMDQLLRAKALSAVYETPHCPIVGAVARRALHITRGSAPRFVHDGYHQQDLVPRDEKQLPEFSPTAATRKLFSDKFGIDETTQMRVEELVAKGDMKGASQLLVTNSEMRIACRYVGAG